MPIIIKHKLLCIGWNIAPKRVKAALYKKHRAIVEKRQSIFTCNLLFKGNCYETYEIIYTMQFDDGVDVTPAKERKEKITAKDQTSALVRIGQNHPDYCEHGYVETIIEIVSIMEK